MVNKWHLRREGEGAWPAHGGSGEGQRADERRERKEKKEKKDK